MIYLLVGPLGLFFIFRILLPSIWCFDFLITNDSAHKYYEIVSFHLMYLFLEGFLTALLVIYIVNKVSKYRKYRDNQAHINNKDREAKKYAFVALLGLLIFLGFNFNTLPVFMDGGSDAMVALGQEQKGKTWFMYGMLTVLSTLLLFSIVSIKSKGKKYVYGFLLILFSLVTGKKSSLISILSKFMFVYYLINPKKPSLPFIKIAIALILSSLFVIFQFSRTSGLSVDYFDAIAIIMNLVYSSFTSYLVQFVNMEGLEFAQMYSDGLGSGGPIVYILNSFTQVLFGTGIEKSIGPYLTYQFYGSEFPNGVNPILFFEYIFVFGSYTAIPFSFINLIVMFMLAKIFIKKVIINIDKSILLMVTYFGLFLFALGYTIHSLDAIRMLPFTFIPMLWHYLIILLMKASNKK
jgi:hypothetical protein